jgi:hypothetical protein
VSVQPPLSQILMGATLLMIRFEPGEGCLMVL